MKTKFIPKEVVSPRHTFGELEVGQGFRSNGGGIVYIKVSAGDARNCVSTADWTTYNVNLNLDVTPVDLELREL